MIKDSLISLTRIGDTKKMDSLLANLASIVTILTGVISVIKYFIDLSRRQNHPPSPTLPANKSYPPQRSLPQPLHVSTGRRIIAGVTATIGIGSIFFASIALLDEIFSSSNGAVDTEAIAISIVFMVVGIVILYVGRIK